MIPGAERFGSTAAGGPRYGDLIAAVRALTDTVSITDAPDQLVDQAIGDLARITAELGVHASTHELHPAGHRWELPARGHPLVIPFQIEYISEKEMRGRVRLSRAHMGHAGITHGGFLPLIFDEALGVFPMQLDPPGRTASLRVDYKAATPVETDLAISAELVRQEDRKMLVRGALHYAGQLLAEAEGLFIQPRTETDTRKSS